jgi:hypothetical protein
LGISPNNRFTQLSLSDFILPVAKSSRNLRPPVPFAKSSSLLIAIHPKARAFENVRSVSPNARESAF